MRRSRHEQFSEPLQPAPPPLPAGRPARRPGRAPGGSPLQPHAAAQQTRGPRAAGRSSAAGPHRRLNGSTALGRAQRRSSSARARLSANLACSAARRPSCSRAQSTASVQWNLAAASLASLDRRHADIDLTLWFESGRLTHRSSYPGTGAFNRRCLAPPRFGPQLPGLEDGGWTPAEPAARRTVSRGPPLSTNGGARRLVTASLSKSLADA